MQIPIAKLSFSNTAFMFRAVLRVDDLCRSIAAEGQQIPIIVRPSAGEASYQIISGFRRATAMRRLGITTIAAVVREDLRDDSDAFRVAVIENEQRQTYSDLDRALVILRYQQAGWGGFDIAELMGLGRRQYFNIRSLLELPQPVRDAIADPACHFGATHGIELGRLARRHPGLDVQHWIDVVNERSLSVRRMKREAGQAHRAPGPAALGSIFEKARTDRERGVFRLRAVKIVPDELSEDDREQLRDELRGMLELLEG